MSLNKIFDLVRKEQAVFWVGSGFSKYAGYPTGEGLAEILHKELSIEEQAEISKTLLLPDLSEEFVRVKYGSRNELNSILRNVFLKKPSTTKYHDLLSKISHVKTIITTNYDELFENAFEQEAIKIVEEKDVANTGKVREIFKIHGDLSIPDSIVITKSDYGKFFYNKTDLNLLWNVVSERISNKAIIFIGYSYEDLNVINLITKIQEALKGNAKNIYLIAPKFNKYKVDDLNRRGIEYIDLKGEVFVEKLFKNLQENIVEDFDRGFVQPETFKNFLAKEKLNIGLKSANDKFRLSSISGMDGDIKGLANFSFKNDKDFLEDFSAFVRGEKFGKLEIDNNVLNKFNISISGINLLPKSIKDLNITLVSQPITKGLVDIIFKDKYEISNLSYEIFKSEIKTQVNIRYKNSLLFLTLLKDESEREFVKLSFKFEQKGTFEKVQDAIKILELLKRISIGMSMKIYHLGMNKVFDFTPLFTTDKDLNYDNRMKYFNLMKEVEDKFNVHFTNFGEPTDEDYDKMCFVLKYYNETENLVKSDDVLTVDFEQNENSKDFAKKLDVGKDSFRVAFRKKTEVEIHGENIFLGYKTISFNEPYIENLESIINEKGTSVKVKSKNETIKVKYLKSIEDPEE